ncbi:sulfotransferase family protein [Aestuariibius sp. 2305UL40-4]|uniref:sulfotransferase family protein n=1 Tax=Aestuariibius violaceus TaxID=3234132 RepID=UPI00345E3BAC
MEPDFIIGGAPKCGTTSLHQILDRHPRVWMAPNEVYFHDADDPVAHPDFLSVQDGSLIWRDPDGPAMRDWYAERFADAPAGAVLGEDSTTYLMSDVGPHRIARSSRTKTIIMLRDPVRRAVSQYWHLLRSGRTHLTLERALSAEPSIIAGSTYAPRLRAYREALGPERMHVFLFEDFNADRQRVLDGVTDYLEIDRLSVGNADNWHNRTRYPRRMATLRRWNRVGRYLVRYRYARYFGSNAPLRSRAMHKAYRVWFNHVSRAVLTEDAPPEALSDGTRDFLVRHLSARNAGLSDFLGRDLAEMWPGFTQ